MKLVEANFKILTEIKGNEILTAIERAGRTCYKSEDSITDESAHKFIQMLINRGHESVLEHQSVSVLFVCDRGVSHELVRHRLASFSQESTRYCNYQKEKFGNELTFIAPLWVRQDRIDFVNERGFSQGLGKVVKGTNGENECFYLPEEQTFFYGLHHIESAYMDLIKYGWQPQQARSILPNCLKTEIVVTANLREWRTIFKQRTSPAAHPQMRELMIPLLMEMENKIPVIFDDIQL